MMTTERAMAWAEAFLLFGEVWPQLLGTHTRIRVWDGALEDLTPSEIVEGARRLVAEHTHGPPAPGNLRAIVASRARRVPVHATDPWGRVILGPHGPTTIGWIQLEAGDRRTHLTDTEAKELEHGRDDKLVPLDGQKESAAQASQARLGDPGKGLPRIREGS